MAGCLTRTDTATVQGRIDRWPRGRPAPGDAARSRQQQAAAWASAQYKPFAQTKPQVRKLRAAKLRDADKSRGSSLGPGAGPGAAAHGGRGHRPRLHAGPFAAVQLPPSIAFLTAHLTG